MKEKRNYNGGIDLWKFIFCMIILIFHVGEYYGTGYVWLPQGSYAVEFFFIVSGYFMCVSANKMTLSQEAGNRNQTLGKETISFILKKIKGILPAYLFAYAISLIVWLTYVGAPLYTKSGLHALIRKLVGILPNFLLIFNSAVKGTAIMNISWYISAMLAAMLIIYPLLRKYNDVYRLVIAPAVVLFLTGFVYYNCESYGGYLDFEVFTTKGVIRAFIGLNIGCLVYSFAQYLRKFSFTALSRVLLLIGELGLYGVIICLMQTQWKEAPYFITILLFFAISITCSKCSIWASALDNKVSVFLGRTTLFVYLCQSSARQLVWRNMPDATYHQAFVGIVGLTIVLTAVGMLLTKGISIIYNKNKASLVRLFIRC